MEALQSRPHHDQQTPASYLIFLLGCTHTSYSTDLKSNLSIFHFISNFVFSMKNHFLRQGDKIFSCFLLEAL